MSHPRPRIHALDTLRAGAMLLGVQLHAATSFFDPASPNCTTPDRARHEVFRLIYHGIHGFRMPLFFLLAGLFAALSVERRGAGDFARNRLRRVGLPLVLAAVTIQPAPQATLVYNEARLRHDLAAGRVAPRAYKFHALRPDDPPVAPRAAVVRHFATGRFLGAIRPVHLWFLESLLILNLETALVLRLGRSASGRFAARLDQLIDLLLGSPWPALGLAAPTAVLILPMRNWQADTPGSWVPSPVPLLFHGAFYLLGWGLHRRRERLADLGRGWAAGLPLALLVVLPLSYLLTSRGPALVGQGGGWPMWGAWLGAVGLNGLYAALMVGGLIGLALRYGDRPGPAAGFLAESAYWCYLVHLLPVVVLQTALADRAGPAWCKYALVNVGALGISLAAYPLVVRHTSIGGLLNGRRPDRGRSALRGHHLGRGRALVEDPVAPLADRRRGAGLP